MATLIPRNTLPIFCILLFVVIGMCCTCGGIRYRENFEEEVLGYPEPPMSFGSYTDVEEEEHLLEDEEVMEAGNQSNIMETTAQDDSAINTAENSYVFTPSSTEMNAEVDVEEDDNVPMGFMVSDTSNHQMIEGFDGSEFHSI